MKALAGRTLLILKIAAFAFISIAVFNLSRQRHWYSTTRTTTSSSEQVNVPSTPQENHLSLPPFASPSYNLSSSRSRSSSSSIISTTFAITDQNRTQISLPPVSPPPPSGLIRKFGIVDSDGRMCDDFEVGEFYSDPEAEAEEEEEEDGEEDKRVIQVLGSENFISVRVKRYEWCPEEMTHYVPCMDSPESGKTLERRCPDKGKELNCMIPPPKSYRPPIPWPRSRDELWYGNVPRTRGESWISKEKDKYKLAGGGSAKYLDQIARMIPNIAFGTSTRVALDVGCGLGSFGAYMFSRNVITMSVAPKGVNENQIQFALERGVPAMVAALVSHRLSYPSQAFELIHCSKCEINWTRDDGILLLEVNRILRAGGYFVWAALPVQKQDQEHWKEIFDLANRLCWELVRRERDTAIWRKPLDNSCYLSREEGAKPPLCEPDDDPDIAWNVSLKACITRLPENGYGGNVRTWPARLNSPPDRLQGIQIDPQISRKELMKAEGNYWSEIVTSYVRAFHWKKLKLRNIMDMRAGYGGFAAALVDQGFDSWVLNVVPVSGPNTLPVIYDRGLIGVIHDWCEPFDTYPRTYDLLHAAGLFSVERKRCKMSTIMLEMDRMLRPDGRAYIQDSLDVMDELQWIAKAMGWQTTLQNTFEGPYAGYRILRCDKHLLHP